MEKNIYIREANVVQFPDDEPLVYCKQYPECNGSLIDMMKVKKNKPQANKPAVYFF